ncbi:unnamed protein product, partial [Brassica rapa subsp. narinosa]
DDVAQRRWSRNRDDSGRETGTTVAQRQWSPNRDDDSSDTVVQGGRWLRLIDDESQCWKRKTI